MSTTHEVVKADHGAQKKRPLVRVEPQSQRDDGSPIAGEGQAYVTRSGKLFHTQWCSIMDGHWRAVNGGIYVTMIADVGLRGHCPQCDQDPEAKKRSKLERAEKRAERLRLKEEANAEHRAKERPLVRVEPQSHRDDGSPVAGAGQVYVTRTGKLFHTQWCSIMDGQWRAGQRGIYVTKMADVGRRGRCTQCDRDPEAMKRSKFDQAELRRLNQELDQLGRTIARTLVVKGPEGVNTLGPQVIRFRETEAELTALSGRVGASFPYSNEASNS
ncbi:hypothetical protein [Paenarthrobacter ureafaciens]|uniref:hypothetical protein n=1 Tax=Paenarthrobacter ureafaciens TaxID=37931 RepID=UPI0022651999|nr:hypothetical protein [Paenarthrobacter ureafaciens]MCX8452828.1 hypothetical protein [Paenarthrobacter ureafaciens]MCY0971466.1 hypothetical protein [Paenarthrobacter ureafaciens]